MRKRIAEKAERKKKRKKRGGGNEERMNGRRGGQRKSWTSKFSSMCDSLLDGERGSRRSIEAVKMSCELVCTLVAQNSREFCSHVIYIHIIGRKSRKAREESGEDFLQKR